MALYGFTGSANRKSFLSRAEASVYTDGGNRPTINRSLQAYLEASSRLDTVIRTTASVASGAFLEYGKVDSKGKFVKSKFKQADGLYMNDYQTEGDFLFELFGTLLTYDKVLIIPEESKYKNRSGMIDWTIVPDTNFQANIGTNQTIDSFTYTSTSGAKTTFKYEECIYITRNLTATNIIYAIPRLKSLTKSIENILGIHNFMGEYIASGGKSSVVISTDSLLSEEQGRKVKKNIQEFLNSNAPKALLLNSEKFSLEKVSDSLSTSGVLDIMAQISNEITKSFNMPLFLLGEYSSSSQGLTVLYANRTWFEIQVRPLFNSLEKAFTRHFRDAFGIKNSMIRFNFSNIQLLEDSDTDKLAIVDKAIKIGTMSINEGRAMMGWEAIPYEGADKHFVPAYMLGQNPVAFETFDEDVARNLGTNAPTDTMPNGTGGENQTPDMNGVA